MPPCYLQYVKNGKNWYAMFCTCGAMIQLPLLTSEEIKCARCSRVLTDHSFAVTTTSKEYVHKEEAVQCERKGAKIKMKCPQCGSDEMHYNTAQLRSADEGQTVFYTCDCGYKETVNS